MRWSKLDTPFFDGNATSLNGCKYPFMLRHGYWIKVKDLPETMDRDICLSYSFFHLLKRRCDRFDCAESGNEKVRDFVLKGLLPDTESPGYCCKRAFRIVEEQLTMLHDCFFASIYSNFFSKAESLIINSLFLRLYPFSVMCMMAVSTSHSIFAAIEISIHTLSWWCQKEYILASDRHALLAALTRIIFTILHGGIHGSSCHTGRIKSGSTHLSKTMTAALRRIYF